MAARERGRDPPAWTIDLDVGEPSYCLELVGPGKARLLRNANTEVDDEDGADDGSWPDDPPSSLPSLIQAVLGSAGANLDPLTLAWLGLRLTQDGGLDICDQEVLRGRRITAAGLVWERRGREWALLSQDREVARAKPDGVTLRALVPEPEVLQALAVFRDACAAIVPPQVRPISVSTDAFPAFDFHACGDPYSGGDFEISEGDWDIEVIGDDCA